MDEKTGIHTYVVLTSADMGGRWGKGATLEEALKNARREGGNPGKYGYSVAMFGPGSEFDKIDGMGYVYWKGEKPTIDDSHAPGVRDARN